MKGFSRRETIKSAAAGAFCGFYIKGNWIDENNESWTEELDKKAIKWSDKRDRAGKLWAEKLEKIVGDYRPDEEIKSKHLTRLLIPSDYQDFIQPEAPEIRKSREPGDRLVEKDLEYESDIIESFQKPEKTERTGKGDCEDLGFHQGSATDQLDLNYRVVFGASKRGIGHALLEFEDRNEQIWEIPCDGENQTEPVEADSFEWEPYMYFTKDQPMKKYSEDYF